MSETLRGLRVFIASPGGLEDERVRFRQTVEEVNREANERGITFIPVGWEYATPGLGRPQAKINAEVERCDYMVLVLHDRWGTPPSVQGKYSSGTEEEYEVARRCATDEEMPMRNIAVLFKGVEPRQLSDPGEQLRKVLAFKQRLELERSLLFKTFDSTSEYERELRALLYAWMREEENGGTTAAVRPVPPSEPQDPAPLPAAADGQDSQNLLDRANQLVDEGKFTAAESLYASAVVARTDVDAMTQYTRFLRRRGRLDMAQTMADRLYEVGRSRGDVTAMLEALSNSAIIARQRGNNARANEQLEQAISIAREAGDAYEGDLAFLLDNVGLTLRKQGRFSDALDKHLEALEIRRRRDDPRGLATTLNHAAALLRQIGRLDTALEMTQESVRVFESLGYERGEAQARANLGELLEESGDLSAARDQYQHSLTLNQKLDSPQGIGMNLWQLGRLALENGDLDKARIYALDSLEKARVEGVTRPDALAAPLQLLGNVQVAEQRYEAAIEELDAAATIFEQSGQTLGLAWSLADLAVANAAAGRLEAAQESLARAQAASSTLTHRKFQRALDSAREAVSNAGERGTAGGGATEQAGPQPS